MVVRVKVRVFTFPSDPREQNSYVVGTMEGGHLLTVGTLRLEDEEVEGVTFRQLRPRIELQDDNGMIRLLFQEVLAIATVSPNPHGWPASALQTYWFGFFSDPDQAIPQALKPTEEDAPISQFLDMKTSKQTGDLILIPQTQFGPVCEQCCQGCPQCPPLGR
ncbi:hypothetical protein P43SY_005844 [Pythium insidiosum]|uniref:Uncharacterized protein n=1 Tax=Pythium insidiosum TaxID=114742 RepID=A0AAD5LR67_PYTIN|nr:hypothetical protein P43SY_005844 [Pythium insidiosum]